MIHVRPSAALAVALILSASANGADFSSFVDLPSGMIIGAHSEKGWLQSEQAGKAIKPGGKYRLFTLAGAAGEATGGKAAPNEDVCPDVWQQPFKPEVETHFIAVAAPWNPMPRTARKSDKTQEVYLKAARDFLINKGIAKPIVKITQLLRVDLDGDGEDEVLLSATNYADKESDVPHDVKAGNYSFVLLRHVVDGKLRTQLIDGEFYPKANDAATPNRYDVVGLLDLDGDGRLEIVLRSLYYEGGATSVWQFASGKLRRLLEVGCGA